jgi:PAS domain S-box-containing protein
LAAFLTGVFMVCVAAYMVRKLRQEEVLTANLRDATDRYHHTIDSVMDAVVAVDESLIIRLFNPAAELMFGYQAEHMLGRPLSDLMPERSRAGHDLHVGRFMRSDVASRAMSLAPQLDITGLRSDGSEFPIESTISQTWIGQHKQLTAVLRDVTQRRRAEAEVYRTNQQLRELSAALQHVREEERARIARELHDELGQQLTGLKLDLSWLANRLKEGREANPDNRGGAAHCDRAEAIDLGRLGLWRSRHLAGLRNSKAQWLEDCVGFVGSPLGATRWVGHCFVSDCSRVIDQRGATCASYRGAHWLGQRRNELGADSV